MAVVQLHLCMYHTQVCHSGSGTVTSVYHTQVCHSGSGTVTSVYHSQVCHSGSGTVTSALPQFVTCVNGVHRRQADSRGVILMWLVTRLSFVLT